jgi:hypothetical protein
VPGTLTGRFVGPGGVPRPVIDAFVDASRRSLVREPTYRLQPTSRLGTPDEMDQATRRSSSPRVLRCRRE